MYKRVNSGDDFAPSAEEWRGFQMAAETCGQLRLGGGAGRMSSSNVVVTVYNSGSVNISPLSAIKLLASEDAKAGLEKPIFSALPATSNSDVIAILLEPLRPSQAGRAVLFGVVKYPTLPGHGDYVAIDPATPGKVIRSTSGFARCVVNAVILGGAPVAQEDGNYLLEWTDETRSAVRFARNDYKVSIPSGIVTLTQSAVTVTPGQKLYLIINYTPNTSATTWGSFEAALVSGTYQTGRGYGDCCVEIASISQPLGAPPEIRQNFFSTNELIKLEPKYLGDFAVFYAGGSLWMLPGRTDVGWCQGQQLSGGQEVYLKVELSGQNFIFSTTSTATIQPGNAIWPLCRMFGTGFVQVQYGALFVGARFIV